MKQLIIFLGVVGTSLSSVFVRWSTAPSLVLVFYRMVISVLILGPIVLTRHRDEFKLLNRKLVLLCIVSGIFLGMHFVTFFSSLSYTSITSASVLVHMEVLFVALETVLFLRTKLSGKAWVAMLLAFGGSVIVAMADSAAGGHALRGDILALISAICLGSYTVVGSMCRKTLGNLTYNFLIYTATMVTVLILILANGMPLTGYGTVNYMTALAMTVFCTLLGHTVFNWGLKYFNPTYISTIRLLDSIFSALWGLVFFSELPSVFVVVGGVIITAGVALYGQVNRNGGERMKKS